MGFGNLQVLLQAHEKEQNQTMVIEDIPVKKTSVEDIEDPQLKLKMMMAALKHGELKVNTDVAIDDHQTCSNTPSPCKKITGFSNYTNLLRHKTGSREQDDSENNQR